MLLYSTGLVGRPGPRRRHHRHFTRHLLLQRYPLGRLDLRALVLELVPRRPQHSPRMPVPWDQLALVLALLLLAL